MQTLNKYYLLGSFRFGNHIDRPFYVGLEEEKIKDQALLFLGVNFGESAFSFRRNLSAQFPNKVDIRISVSKNHSAKAGERIRSMRAAQSWARGCAALEKLRRSVYSAHRKTKNNTHLMRC